jgi:hypothetical protein
MTDQHPMETARRALREAAALESWAEMQNALRRIADELPPRAGIPVPPLPDNVVRSGQR